MSDNLKNTQIAVLREEIAQALENGQLESKMDVIKLKGANLDLSMEDLNVLIAKEKQIHQNAEKAEPVVKANKKYIYLALIVVLALELFLPLGWIMKVIIMLVSAVAIVFISSAIIASKTKR